MNKLELLYKVMGNMKELKEVNGTLKVNVVEKGNEIINAQNNFYKNCETKEMKGHVTGFFIEDGNKINLDENIELSNLKEKKKALKEQMKKEIGEDACKCEMKRKCKIGKVMFGLKLLNEIELTQEEGMNVLNLDLMKFKEEHDKMHAMKNADHLAKKVEFMKALGIPEVMIRLKGKMMQEVHKDLDIATARIFVNENNMIEKVLLEGQSKANDMKVNVSITK